MRFRKATANRALSRLASPARPLICSWPRSLGPRSGEAATKAPTSVTLFDQGLTQILEAAVTGLQPEREYVLALAQHPNGGGKLEPLADFKTNPAGSAIVNAVGPIRQIVHGEDRSARRYLVVLSGTPDKPGTVAQAQIE
jgi:hypothetical protein